MTGLQYKQMGEHIYKPHKLHYKHLKKKKCYRRMAVRSQFIFIQRKHTRFPELEVIQI